MPNDNKQQTTTAPPIIFTEDALPPMPQENSGSAAPADDIVMPAVTTTSTPKKKFAGGKVIATILGLFLLVGGIGAGVFLVGQNQDIREKAGRLQPQCATNPDCGPGEKCKSGKCVQEQQQPQCTTNPDCGPGEKCVNNKCVSLSAQCVTNPDCNSGEICNNSKCIPAGNCQDNTGNCYVKTKIGVGEGDKQVCDGPHWTTCAEGYVCSNEDCVPSGTKTQNSSTSNPSNNETTTTTTTTTTPTAQCQNIKAYSPTWALLTNAQLSTLTVGSQVNFCVTGSASDGTFDKARLTINGILQTETNTIRPGSTDFCQLYTIPAGTINFNVTAQIHHLTLGWK